MKISANQQVNPPFLYPSNASNALHLVLVHFISLHLTLSNAPNAKQSSAFYFASAFYPVKCKTLHFTL